MDGERTLSAGTDVSAESVDLTDSQSPQNDPNARPPIAAGPDAHKQPTLATNRFAVLNSSTVRKANLLKSPVARDICKLTERMVVSMQGGSSQVSNRVEAEAEDMPVTKTALKKLKKEEAMQRRKAEAEASGDVSELRDTQMCLDVEVSSDDDDDAMKFGGGGVASTNSAPAKLSDERLKRIEQFAGGKKAAARYAAKNCSQKNCELLKSNSHQELQHKFTHLLVTDFEATCDSAEPDYPHEIIEFPCVAVDLKTLKVVSEFGTFVRPVNNPILTEFCTELTTIKQADVENAPTITEAIAMFNTWLEKLKTDFEASEAEAEAVATAAEVAQASTTATAVAAQPPASSPAHKARPFTPVFATDGPWDMRKFMHECHVIRDGVCFPELFYKWIDVRRCFSDFFHKQLFKLTKMLRALGMTFVGERHRGIDDSRNIARVAIALAKRGYKFRQTAHVPYHAEGSKLLEHERTTLALLREIEDEEARKKAKKKATKTTNIQNSKKK